MQSVKQASTNWNIISCKIDMITFENKSFFILLLVGLLVIVSGCPWLHPPYSTVERYLGPVILAFIKRSN